MVSVGDQRRAIQPAPASKPHLRSDLVADEANHARRRKYPEMAERLWMKETLDGGDESDAGRHEDRANHEQPGNFLAADSCEGRRQFQGESL